MSLAATLDHYNARFDFDGEIQRFGGVRRDPLYADPVAKATPQEVHDTVRLLVEIGHSDPMMVGIGVDGLSTKLIDWCGPPETLQWLTQ